MLYPPKKRAYSPENKKTKDLSNLMNINSKFTGSGGSTSFSMQTPPPSPPKNSSPYQSPPLPASSGTISNTQFMQSFG
jgi:hypothetical protein